eukprot:TRINITY_DN3052_c0_g1_i2.p2 TRINITY_DN3052_c0_g1~~TRINITY_DN3052_c0_g1_i2.p2  ORF type:complete len:409 (-),score=111.82 TRINITY_DN3052_c0_g1_i2:671-1897(-)
MLTEAATLTREPKDEEQRHKLSASFCDALQHGIPSYNALELIMAFYINTQEWDGLNAYCKTLKNNIFSSGATIDNKLGTLCDVAYLFSAMIKEARGRTPHPPESIKALESLLANFLALIVIPSAQQAESGECIEWSSSGGLLCALRGAAPLQFLVALLAGCLAQCQRARRLLAADDVSKQQKQGKRRQRCVHELCLARYGPLAEVGAMFSSQLVLPLEESMQHVFQATLERLVSLEPFPADGRWLAGLGDAHYQHRRWDAALRYYAAAGAVETDFFCSQRQSPSFTSVLPRTVKCLTALRAFTPAAVLCQFDGRTVKAFSLLQRAPPQVLSLANDAAYLHYFWDPALLELLVYIHSQKTRDERKLALLLRVIGDTQLNENNSAEERAVAIQRTKSNFLRSFVADVLLR